MNIRDVMTAPVEVADDYMMLDEAADLMQSANVGVLPVVQNGRLLGLLTDRDIVVRAVAHGDDPAQTTVGETMTSESVSVSEDQSLEEALNLMAKHQVRRLPVVDESQHVVGMLSLGDVVARTETIAPVMDTLRAICTE